MAGASDAGTAPSDESRRLERVIEALRRRAGSSGFLPFDRFVEIALYAPEIGFYTRRGLELGRGGDFYTAAHVSPLFGATLAARIKEEYLRLGAPETFQVVEVGPGDGTLTTDLLGSLARDPHLGSHPLAYDIVERSPALVDRLRPKLEGLHSPNGRRMRYSSSLAGLGPFVGVLVANEVLDAFPFRRLIVRDGNYQELGVRFTGDTLDWAEEPVRTAVTGPPLPQGLEEGSVVEISSGAEAFLREVGDQLIAGAALFLDYGEDEPALVHRHPRGTLTAFRRHRIVENPLEAPGSSDLSAHVNFRRIRAAAQRAGLRETAYDPQSVALGRWGFPALQADALRGAKSEEEKVRLALAAKNLLFGFENFKALELEPAAVSVAK
ncbi:MAG TPA: SAM-dependent methyltransferase [Thermoplasmata archaeon]|nr:SAM-dependent methyltransferase [Thermoplasmata archaeon]